MLLRTEGLQVLLLRVGVSDSAFPQGGVFPSTVRAGGWDRGMSRASLGHIMGMCAGVHMCVHACVCT